MRTNTWPRIVTAAFMLMIGTFGRAQAGIILYSTFGPGNSFIASQGLTISGVAAVTNPGYNAVANQFSVPTSAALDTMELALFTFSPNDSVAVELRADSAGRLGAILESYTLTNLPFVSAEIVTVKSITHTELLTSSLYWLAVVPLTDTTLGGWNDNSIEAHGLTIQSHDGDFLTGTPGDFQPLGQSAFRITGIPEPASITLLGVGLLALVVYLWSRNRLATVWELN